MAKSRHISIASKKFLQINRNLHFVDLVSEVVIVGLIVSCHVVQFLQDTGNIADLSHHLCLHLLDTLRAQIPVCITFRSELGQLWDLELWLLLLQLVVINWNWDVDGSLSYLRCCGELLSHLFQHLLDIHHCFRDILTLAFFTGSSHFHLVSNNSFFTNAALHDLSVGIFFIELLATHGGSGSNTHKATTIRSILERSGRRSPC